MTLIEIHHVRYQSDKGKNTVWLKCKPRRKYVQVDQADTSLLHISFGGREHRVKNRAESDLQEWCPINPTKRLKLLLLMLTIVTEVLFLASYFPPNSQTWFLSQGSDALGDLSSVPCQEQIAPDSLRVLCGSFGPVFLGKVLEKMCGLQLLEENKLSRPFWVRFQAELQHRDSILW